MKISSRGALILIFVFACPSNSNKSITIELGKYHLTIAHGYGDLELPDRQTLLFSI